MNSNICEALISGIISGMNIIKGGVSLTVVIDSNSSFKNRPNIIARGRLAQHIIENYRIGSHITLKCYLKSYNVCSKEYIKHHQLAAYDICEPAYSDCINSVELSGIILPSPTRNPETGITTMDIKIDTGYTTSVVRVTVFESEISTIGLHDGNMVYITGHFATRCKNRGNTKTCYENIAADSISTLGFVTGQTA